jgi:aryl sulfotransferase
MPIWPVKTRELHNHHFDSTIWNGFTFRDDDIIIATYGKSGTTWVQQIVAQLIFQGAEHGSVGELSPWFDLRVPPKEVKLAAMAAQAHRRFIKTHLPVDALVYSPKAKYLYVGRDGRDVVWSLYNHHAAANELWYKELNESPGLVGPPIGKPPESLLQYFREWLDGDGYPFWPFWENVRSWWEIRELPNLMLLHFADLKADLPGQMRRIAAFLDIVIDETAWPVMADRCTFGYMKGHAAETAPAGGRFWDGGGAAFFNKGTNGRWREVLTPEDVKRYDTVARRELGPACTDWLANGALAKAATPAE